MCVNLNVVTLTSLIQNTTRRTLLATAHTLLLTLGNDDRRKTFAAAGILDSHAHTNDPESITDPML